MAIKHKKKKNHTYPVADIVQKVISPSNPWTTEKLTTKQKKHTKIKNYCNIPRALLLYTLGTWRSETRFHCGIGRQEVLFRSSVLKHVKKQRNIPLFHSEIGFTFGWVFIYKGKLCIRRVRKRKITRPLCFIKQNKLFFVYDLFY